MLDFLTVMELNSACWGTFTEEVRVEWCLEGQLGVDLADNWEEGYSKRPVINIDFICF